MNRNFIFWHYISGIGKFLEVWGNFLVFFWRYFAITWHLRTLFSSWKRDISKSGRRGLHPILWLQSAAENIITRFLGAIVRSFVILAGIVVEILSVFLGTVALVVWIFLPLFLLLIIFSVSSALSGNYLWASFEGVLFGLAVAVLIFSRILFKDSKKNYQSMTLGELERQEWFSRVWERLGKAPTESTVNSMDNPQLLKRFLEACNVTEQEFEKIVGWELKTQSEKEKMGKFWLKENLSASMPIGRNWTYAYTVNLDKFSTDLSESDPTEYKDSKLIGHNQDLKMMELILTRPGQNNVLVVGEAGVGKHTLVHELAARVRKGEVNPALSGKRVVELNLNEIVSGAVSVSGVESNLRQVFFESAYAGNVILVVGEFDRYLKDHPENQKENISAILLEFLNYPTFQIIGLTAPQAYHDDLEKNEAVMKYFDKIQIGESSFDDTMEILFQRLKEVEQDRIIFMFQALREIIKLSERYLSDAPFPEKALDLLEETIVFWSQNPTGRYITEQVVDEVVSQKVKVPIGDIGESEKDKLLNLEEILHRRVIGQNFAIGQIAETMRRARAGMASESKPIGSFLFLGPTGVGKTESAKALAEAYFGDENRMIRLDMSEYQKEDSLGRLIGSDESGRTGILADKVRENPYALLLLDEIEKAYPDILNLFLQILDEGWLTDVFGKKVNFKSQIIIATSNAGAEIIKQEIEKNRRPEEIQKEVTDFVIKNGIFRPEFLNRFEGVVFFHPLSREDLVKVTQLILERYAKRIKKEKNVRLDFEPDVISKIIEKAYDPVFGARAVNRYVEDKIGDNIVKRIIAGEIKKGTDFVFKAEDLV